MKVTFFAELTVPVGFLVHIRDDGLSAALYRLAQDGDPKTSVQDGKTIHRSLAKTLVAVSEPVNISYADLQKRPEFSDHGLWAIPLRGQALQQPFGLPFNRAVETQASKRMAEESPHRQENVPLRLLVPFKSSSWADCALHVSTNPGLPLIVNADPVRMELAASINQAMPRIQLALPALQLAPDGYGIADLSVTDSLGAVLPVSCDLYLEETGGYLPRRRIQVVDGRASFKVGALGLEAGDSFRVKVGFRHFSGLADLHVTVA